MKPTSSPFETPKQPGLGNPATTTTEALSAEEIVDKTFGSGAPKGLKTFCTKLVALRGDSAPVISYPTKDASQHVPVMD